MDKTFKSHWCFTRVFFDVLLVLSKALEECKEDLKIIFGKLKKHKLYINSKKSEFFLQEINYLGHVIWMDPSKLKFVEEWPQPRNLHELRSFIEMCYWSNTNEALGKRRLFKS